MSPPTTTHHQPKYIHHYHHHPKHGPPPSQSENISIYNILLTLLVTVFLFDTIVRYVAEILLTVYFLFENTIVLYVTEILCDKVDQFIFQIQNFYYISRYLRFFEVYISRI